MTVKECLRCKEKKEINCFPIDKIRDDGFHPYCKSCKAKEQIIRNEEKRKYSLANHKLNCQICLTDKYEADFLRNDKVLRYNPVCNMCHERIKNTQCKKKKDCGKKRDRSFKCKVKLEMLLLLGGKCGGCGLTVSETWPPACFDFHHKDPNEKEFLISSKYRHRDELLKEIKKCEILCSNCHRKHHSKNWEKVLVFYISDYYI